MVERIRTMWKKGGAAILFVLVVSLFASSATAEEVMQSEFQVKNLSCGSCLSRIAYGLRTLGKVSGMRADLRRGKVVIDHDASLSAEKIAQTITDLGYPATLIAISKKGQSLGQGTEKPVPGKKTSEQQEYGKDRMTTTLGVANMSCGSCLAKISDAVTEVDPTVKVYGDLRTRKVAIVHSDKVSTETVTSSIAELGFVVKVLDTKKGIFQSGIDNSLQVNASGTDCSGGGCGTTCAATSSSWKRLYDKYFSKKK